jgi:signal transduction histidine kinase
VRSTFANALILSVDDNEASRYAIGRTLRQSGFRVIEAGTGADALRRAHADTPDLILLDVKLPDIDGFEVCRRLKDDSATAPIPVLQITATYSSTEHWAQALNAGADGYLTHPAEPMVLVATIRALLRAREAERALREANRLKDDFLATLSHELRTPLNAIVGWAHVLRTPNLAPAVTARAVESIQRNAEAQTRLVADILDVSRIVTGKLRIESRRVDLARVVEAAVETVRPSALARQIALEVTTEDAAVQGDPNRLQQIAWNLLTNAVKFTPAGGTVRVRVRHHLPNVQLVVEDTGIGIEPAFIPFVFDRFRQADASMTRTVSGLGLGLALVHDLVQMHGGTVRAESAGTDQGSRFTVSLPAALPSGAETVPAAAPVHPAAEPPGEERSPTPVSVPASLPAGPPKGPLLAGIRVLLVDDDTDFLESLDFALQSQGARVICAASAKEALAAMKEARPDVVVSDLGMPEEDGYGLIRDLRARPADEGGAVPAIALTAYVADHDRDKSLAAGFQLHLGKPMDPGLLVQAIADVVARPRG